MAKHGLVCKPCRPEWINFEFIDTCYEVDEQIYDPEVLRTLIEARLKQLQVPLEQRGFPAETRPEYDFVIWATYGLGPGRGLFKMAKYQVAEKILIELPSTLRGVSLVVVDGPFTAFDPYGSSARSLFGSAKNTNHWTTTDAGEPIPEPYAGLLNRPTFEPIRFSRFDAMRQDSALAVPASLGAAYLGSRFTIRVVEDNPEQDRKNPLRSGGSAGWAVHLFREGCKRGKGRAIVCDRVGSGFKLNQGDGTPVCAVVSSAGDSRLSFHKVATGAPRSSSPAARTGFEGVSLFSRTFHKRQ